MSKKEHTKAELIEFVLDREEAIIKGIVRRAPDHLRHYIRERMNIDRRFKGDLERLVMAQEAYISQQEPQLRPGQVLTEADKEQMVVSINALARENAKVKSDDRFDKHVVVHEGPRTHDKIIWVCNKCWPGTNEVLMLGDLRVPTACELCNMTVSVQEIDPIWQSWLVAVLRRHWEDHKP